MHANSERPAVVVIHDLLASAGLNVSAAQDNSADLILAFDGHVLDVQVKAVGTVRPGDVAALPRLAAAFLLGGEG